MTDNEQAAESLLAYRRDAVAAILMNLYVLAGALRGDRPVPRYLPSAALARKKLLDHMAEIEAEQAQNREASKVDSERELDWMCKATGAAAEIYKRDCRGARVRYFPIPVPVFPIFHLGNMLT